MRVTVIFEDRMVGVDGLFYELPSLTPSDANHRVIQWYLDDHGTIEVYQGDRIWFTDIAPVQPFIDLWNEFDLALKNEIANRPIQVGPNVVA